jgi:hypothetical protein
MKKTEKKKEEAFVEKNEGNTGHTKGKICDKCKKQKPTKKVGNEFLCKDCREGAGTYIRTLGYENLFVCPCGNQEEVIKSSSCKTCGKMLCGLCGDYCTDHLGEKK